MERNRLMMIAAVLAVVVVVAGGFLLGIQPQLKAATTAQQDEASVTSQNATLASNLASLKSQFSKLDTLQTQLANKKKSVPAGIDSDGFIRELNAIAVATGAKVSNITIQPAAAYTAPVSSTPAASTTSTASPSASPSASASATAAPAPSASTPTAPSIATSPLITGANFADIPLTMKITGTYTQMIAFLNGLHKGERLFLVTAVSSNTDSGSNTSNDPSNAPSSSSSASSAAPGWNIGGLIYALTDAASAQQSQQTSTSTAAGSTSGSSSTDTAAGK